MAVLAVVGLRLSSPAAEGDGRGAAVARVSGTLSGYVDVGWKPAPDAVGYALIRDGKQVSSAGATATSTRFLLRKAKHELAVVPLYASAKAPVPETSPPTTTPPLKTVLQRPRSDSSFYSADSPWNTPISADVGVRSESATWIDQLYSTMGPVINVNQEKWTPAIWYADASTPRTTWTMQGGWKVNDVPTPSDLETSAEPETWTAIVDRSTGREYDFFDAKEGSSGWTAEVGGVASLDGSGWWDNRLGPWIGRASGATSIGGDILVSDAKAGVIDHALACAAPKQVIADRAVSPAATSDGGGPASAMPMGSRLQLDPNLDLSSLALPPGEEMIAKALQRYGCYVIDSSSALVLFAENTRFLSTDPYPAQWTDGVTKEIVRHMRVVDPPGRPAYDDRTILGQPHR
jgi:hypothetical protein